MPFALEKKNAVTGQWENLFFASRREPIREFLRRKYGQGTIAPTLVATQEGRAPTLAEARRSPLTWGATKEPLRVTTLCAFGETAVSHDLRRFAGIR